MNKGSVFDALQEYDSFDFPAFFAAVSEQDVAQVLRKDHLSLADYMKLLAPAAEAFLEPMAQKAKDLTARHFGRTILLFTPIYVSDVCSNQCRYCGFSALNTELKRNHLTLEEVELEAQAVAKTGLKHIVFLTGDAPQIASVNYMEECTKIFRKYFSSISIEVYSLTKAEYEQLVQAGVDNMTMFQETYNAALYDTLHLKGPKKDYLFRLDAPERACQSGMASVSIGALLGLDQWRQECFKTGLHAMYLQTKYPAVAVSISVPRMRPHTGEFQPPVAVTDKNLVQYILAYRLFMPYSGITMSSRETPVMRDHMMGIGVTKMSAGACTVVGGHIAHQKNAGQFDTSDERDVSAMKDAILRQGCQPVMKDWQPLWSR
ncbi:MAG: 2-iminoacetate synthase ThiH [Sporomusaceae bacterium]|nr:2-iminoacetate synthase ThiH [Sporomusaceae bacterium]